MTTQDRITIGGFISLAALIPRLREGRLTLGGVMFARIDGVEERLNHRIDGVEERLNHRIDGVEERLNHRIDGVEEHMARLEEGQRELSERMARFEGALSAVVAIADLNPPPAAPEREAPR